MDEMKNIQKTTIYIRYDNKENYKIQLRANNV